MITQYQFDASIAQTGAGRALKLLDRCGECGGHLMFVGRYADGREQYNCERCKLSEVRGLDLGVLRNVGAI